MLQLVAVGKMLVDRYFHHSFLNLFFFSPLSTFLIGVLRSKKKNKRKLLRATNNLGLETLGPPGGFCRR